jgi:3-oxoacyl-[acyl-carrier protein] reductase
LHSESLKSAAGAVIVSGGSRGLGNAIVEQLLNRAYQVATFSRRDSEGLRRWRSDPNFYWEALDSTDYAAVSGFVKAAEQRFGRIGALVNNAAIGAAGILATMPVAEIDQVVKTNLTAPIYLTKVVAARMLKYRQGSIVNISSIHALRGGEGVAVYSATKGALDAITRSLARELGSRGIRVNSVSPGYFASDMVRELDDATIGKIKRRTPLGRLCTVSDVTAVVLFLISDATFITGQTIAVDGGLTC